MNRTKILAAVLITVAMTLPAASATWRAQGTAEPDTVYDRTEGRVFTDPDTSKVCIGSALPPACGFDKLYFNGYVSTWIVAQNPNVATTGSTNWNTVVENHRAIFGLWKDCNKDGYLGQVETALVDYPATVTVGSVTRLNYDPNVCPVQTHVVGGRPVHNDGSKIQEYIPIANLDPCIYKTPDERKANCTRTSDPGDVGPYGVPFHQNPDVIYVNNTFLWYDNNAPNQNLSSAAAAGSCPIRPQPTGTFDSTGGLLQAGDCVTGRAIATRWNQLMTLSTLDPDGSRHLRFEDPNHPETSSSVLDQHFIVHPFSDPYAGPNRNAGLLERDDTNDPSKSTKYDPAFTFDCTNSGGIVVKDPTGQLKTQQHLADDSDTIAIVHQPTITPHNLEGSYWQGAESAYDSVYLGHDGATLAAGGETKPGDCDKNTNNTFHTQYDGTFGFIVGSGNNAGGGVNDVKGKTTHTGYLTYSDANRGVTCWFTGSFGNTLSPGDPVPPFDICDPQRDDQLGGRNMAPDQGINAYRQTNEGWSGSVALLGTASTAVSAERATLIPATQTPAGAVGLGLNAVVRNYTYYAQVDMSTLSGVLLPDQSSGTFGGEHCANTPVPADVNGKPQHAVSPDGWECNPAFWFKDATLTVDQRHKYSEGTIGLDHVVGSPYTLRDVDCYDQHLASPRQVDGPNGPIFTPDIWGTVPPVDPPTGRDTGSIIPGSGILRCDR